jgi:hypothetical protein
MVILEFPSKARVDARIADTDYQEAMTFRLASSTMRMLLVQEGGENTENPDPHLRGVPVRCPYQLIGYAGSVEF